MLRDFGADKVMMLDGGGSTQLICNHSVYVPSVRAIPQAIAVVAGGNPVIAGDNPVINDASVGIFAFSDNQEENVGTSQASLINIGDMKWVLLAIVPVVLILALAISRIQRQVYY